MKERMIDSGQAMLYLGKLIGERVTTGAFIFLSGELGAGKTTLAKGIAQGLGIAAEITSPTFQIMKSYQGRLPLHHLDFYRLTCVAELAVLDLEQLTGVIVIEWGDLLRERLGQDYLSIEIHYTDEPGKRMVRFLPHGWQYQQLSEELSDADFGS